MLVGFFGVDRLLVFFGVDRSVILGLIDSFLLGVDLILSFLGLVYLSFFLFFLFIHSRFLDLVYC